MGFGDYSSAAHAALTADRSARSANEVFIQRSCQVLMNPRGLKIRESRDSAEHPRSLAVAFALDVTGSMGNIPDLIARKELPTFMKLLTACHIADPQLMFMAVGDANSDAAPLQIGQFETTAELMDQWLISSYLEGGGGGTNHESYELAFYVAAQYTDIDCFTKRKKRGYLFLTGDELPYDVVSRHHIEALIGDKLDEDIPIEEVISAACETYHPFFLIPDLQRRNNCEARWRQLLGDHVICMESPEDTCAVAAVIVGLTEGVLPNVRAAASVLAGAGIAPDRIAATIRAVQGYADLNDPDAVKRMRTGTPVPTAAKPAWWKKLFT